jgi:hypothetical protein
LAQSETPLPYAVPEAYEVYSAILPDEWAVSIAGAKRLVIREETTTYKMCLEPEAGFARVVAPAIASYTEVNRKTWSLQRNFHIDLPYLLAAAAGLTNLFNIRGVDGWKEFYKNHPDSGGWIALSAVGFNDDKTVAVVYHAHHCGNLCGGGGFTVLQKKDGKWRPFEFKGAACAWAS